MRGSLRARMTLGFTFSFILFAFGACLAFVFWSARAARIDAEERVAAASQHLALEWKGRTPQEAIAEVHEDARLDGVSMLVVDSKGQILAADGHPRLTWPLSHPGWIVRTDAAEGGHVAAGMAHKPILANVREEAALLAAFAALATGVVGAAAWFLVGRTLRPIGRLADGADVASSDPLRAQLVAPSQDAEITHLVSTLNGFLSRLGEGARNREQFYASAAHELRTPLAVLSAEIEVALSRPRERSEYEASLQELGFQTRRLISLVEGLLTLNRLEMRGNGEAAEIVDPGDVAASLLAVLRPTIELRGLTVEAKLDAETPVAAPANHLEIVVRNLIENAVRHAPVGTRLEIVSGPVFRVTNESPTGAPLDFERMFEPFVQADLSRSTGGNGLGLAICRRVAEVNGWSLGLRQESGRIVAEVVFRPAEKS